MNETVIVTGHKPKVNVVQGYDPVKKPEHYQIIPEKDVQVIDIIEAVLNKEHNLTVYQSACLKDAIKYILRCPFKGSLVEDLGKAKTYIDYILGKRRMSS